MKVLRESKSWSLRVECTGAGNGNRGCGALLEVERDDLRWYPRNEGYMSITGPAVVIRCACCGQTTDIPERNWPHQHEKLRRWSTRWCETGEDPCTS